MNTGELGLGPDADRLRVVSLVPSMTETLLAWGIEPVGVTRFCEAPGIATVGGTKSPDLATIRALRPHLVLMDRQENRSEDAVALASVGLRVHATDVRSVGDVGPSLAAVATLVGAEPISWERLVPAPTEAFFRAWVPIWKRPWMTVSGDTYGSSLLELAGVKNVFAGDENPYPVASLEEARARRPDLVLAPSEPYPFSERHRAELEQVAPVVFVDGRDLFWWGVRTPNALSRLRSLAARLAGR